MWQVMFRVWEGIMLNVAGGFMLEHPLTLPFVDTMVSLSSNLLFLLSDLYLSNYVND